MAKNATRVAALKPPTDGDGNILANEILLGLPRDQCKELIPKLEKVRIWRAASGHP